MSKSGSTISVEFGTNPSCEVAENSSKLDGVAGNRSSHQPPCNDCLPKWVNFQRLRDIESIAPMEVA